MLRRQLLMSAMALPFAAAASAPARPPDRPAPPSPDSPPWDRPRPANIGPRASWLGA